MPPPKRIGILCVHGIGDQQRSQHVDVVARQFYQHLVRIYGAEHVYIDALPGLANAAIVPDVSFAVRIDETFVIFDLVEVWWRDLGERPGFKRLIRFWWWALTLWTTTGFGRAPSRGRLLPQSLKTSKFREFSVSFVERARLFFQSVSFFVLLLPAQLVITLLSLVPFIRRINLFQSIYAYMSSVKLYQQPKNDTKQDVLDHVLSRRVRIQKRLACYFLDMAESNFDQWFVLAHSLGSVIAFKTLMFDGSAFARSLTFDQWKRLDPRWKTLSKLPEDDFVDKPPLPWWLSSTDILDVSAIYDRFGGIVTYGSPIETFANLWPSIIEISNDTNHIQANWINLYDRRDFISSPIRSMNAISKSLPITNIEARSHWLIAKSHTNYLSSKSKSADVFENVILWFAGQRTVTQLSEKYSSQLHLSRVAFAIIMQAIAILAVGAAIFPVALYGLVKLLISGVMYIDDLIQGHSLPQSFYEFLFAVANHVARMKIHFEDDKLVTSGLFESLVIVALVLLILGFTKLLFRYLRFLLSTARRPRPSL